MTLLIAFALMTLVAGRTQATAAAVIRAPTAAVIVGDEKVDLSEFIRYVGDSTKVAVLEGQISVGGNTIIVNGIFNSDPFISFGATTILGGAGPVSFTFLFGTPIVPGFYDTADSTGGLSLTAGTGPATVINGGLYPTAFISGDGTLGAVPTNLGVDIGAGPVSSTGSTTVVSFGPATNTFPLTMYDNLEATLSYTQSGASSVASWSGRVELTATAVPEPSTVIMLGMGALALGATCLRRRLA